MAKGYKSGGRKQGTPNALTSDFKAILAQILSEELEALPGYLTELPPEKRADITVKLLRLVMPSNAATPPQINLRIDQDDAQL